MDSVDDKVDKTSNNNLAEVIRDGGVPAASAFESSFKPLILLLNLFGLYIPTGKIDPHSFSYGSFTCVLFLIGFVFLIADFAFYGYASLVTVEMMNYNHLGHNGTNFTTSVIFSYGLAWFNMAGYTTIVHLSFFIGIWLIPSNWKHLWLNLQEIAVQMNLNTRFYRRIRKIVCVGLLLLLLDTVIFCYPISLSSIWLWNVDWLYPGYLTMLNLTNFIVRTILTLLFVLVFCSADLFTAINHRAKDLILKYQSDNNGSMFASQLEVWKKSHRLVCRFVRRINRCFSIVILVTIGNGYLLFITNAYNLCVGMSADNNPDVDNENQFKSLIFIAILGRELTFLSTFIYASNKVKAEVITTVIRTFFL